MDTPNSDSHGSADVGDLLQRIGSGLKTIASDEVKLARIELVDGIREPLADAAAILLGGIVTVIGLGILCSAIVVALEPAIPALWLRMVLMSGVYFGIGGAIVKHYVGQLRRDTPPGIPRAKREAERTARAIEAEVRDDRSE